MCYTRANEGETSGRRVATGFFIALNALLILVFLTLIFRPLLLKIQTLWDRYILCHKNGAQDGTTDGECNERDPHLIIEGNVLCDASAPPQVKEACEIEMHDNCKADPIATHAVQFHKANNSPTMIPEAATILKRPLEAIPHPPLPKDTRARNTKDKLRQDLSALKAEMEADKLTRSEYDSARRDALARAHRDASRSKITDNNCVDV